MKEQFQRRPRGTGRPFIQVRIPGVDKRLTLWADHDPAYEPSWDTARLNAWAQAARADHRRRFRKAARGAGAGQQASWTLEHFLVERCRRARETLPARELRSLEEFTNAVGNTLREPSCPLRWDMVPAQVSSQVIVDFLTWNRGAGRKDSTATKKLNHIGRCIRECEPDRDDGLLPVYTAFRARVTRAQRHVQCEPTIPRETFFEPHDVVQIAGLMNKATWARKTGWTLRDVFLMLCATGIDFGEAAALTPQHVVKLVQQGQAVKALPWEMRGRWESAEGHYAINFGRGLTGRDDWRNPASVASHKRKSAGVRLAPFCIPEAGDAVAGLVLASASPQAPLFEGLARATLREGLQRTCRRLDSRSGSAICLQGLPNLKSCRRTYSQWGERAGVRQAFLRLAMGQYGAGSHGKHYKVLTPQDAYEIASIGSSYWTRMTQSRPEVATESTTEWQPLAENAAE